jgi:hypothetical protein
MSSHKREDWPAQEAQARAIVNAMGSGWVLRDESHEPAEWRCWEARRLSDGLSLAFDWPEGYGAAKHKGARLQISGVWPNDVAGQRVIIRTPYGEADAVTSITVDASKAPTTIAGDVLRRLVLASNGFERVYRQARELVATRSTYADLQARTVAAVLAAEPGAHISANSGGSTIYLGPTSHGYTLRVDGDSVRFEPFSVPLAAALRILPVLRVSTCAQCGAKITETQAALSSQRADEADPWCKDCCTAALTAQREHEEDDPHCTCTDCVASHAAMLDGQNGIL